MKYILGVVGIIIALIVVWLVLRGTPASAPAPTPAPTPEVTVATSTIAGDYRCGDGTEFSLVATLGDYELLPATSVEHVSRTRLTEQGSKFTGGGVTVEPVQGGVALRAAGVDTTCHKITSTFAADGNVVKDNPGLKPGVWYLVYERAGAPALMLELDLNSVNVPYIDLHQGERVHLEGTLSGTVLIVSSIKQK